MSGKAKNSAAFLCTTAMIESKNAKTAAPVVNVCREFSGKVLTDSKFYGTIIKKMMPDGKKKGKSGETYDNIQG